MGHNCALITPNQVCWIPNPQDLRVWSYLDRGLCRDSKLKRGPWAGTCFNTTRVLTKREKLEQSPREGWQEKTVNCKPQKDRPGGDPFLTSVRRNQSWWHPQFRDSRLQIQETVNSCCWSDQIHGPLLWQPRKLTHTHTHRGRQPALEIKHPADGSPSHHFNSTSHVSEYIFSSFIVR